MQGHKSFAECQHLRNLVIKASEYRRRLEFDKIIDQN